ncbi:unnamed protein product [Brassicogethes aeneus]|uniref:Uncharacterized protein n=1 Tax=Brassicogethes aeneus TaxID=1431903 RepID=A0A9P0BET0_BRAAE|nr:unnamed protein product [Brassicogethes aeneus]
MGNVKYKLYCSWHIDRAWQKNLNKIPNLETRNSVYKTLKTLQQTMYLEENMFYENLNSFITSLQEDPDTANFGHYFISTYFKNCQQWAYCFRKGCGINTNMFLESMHKTVKYFYLNGKTVKCLDKGLHALLNYIRDKVYMILRKNKFNLK